MTYLKTLAFGNIYHYLQFKNLRKNGLSNYERVPYGASEISEEDLLRFSSYDYEKGARGFHLTSSKINASSEAEVKEVIRTFNKKMISAFKNHYGENNNESFRNLFVRSSDFYGEPAFIYISENICSDGTDVLVYFLSGKWISRTEYELTLRSKGHSVADSGLFDLLYVGFSTLLLLASVIFLFPLFFLVLWNHQGRFKLSASEKGALDPNSVDSSFINEDLNVMKGLFREVLTFVAKNATTSDIPRVGHIKASGSAEGS